MGGMCFQRFSCGDVESTLIMEDITIDGLGENPDARSVRAELHAAWSTQRESFFTETPLAFLAWTLAGFNWLLNQMSNSPQCGALTRALIRVPCLDSYSWALLQSQANAWPFCCWCRYFSKLGYLAIPTGKNRLDCYYHLKVGTEPIRLVLSLPFWIFTVPSPSTWNWNQF